MVRARNPQSNGRGGPRAPTPGTQYTNRSDLQQTPTAMPGQTYGQAGAQLAAQRAIPLPAAPTPGGAAAPSGPPGPADQSDQQPLPQPGQFGPLDRPTDRPMEPLTHGSPSGPGAGPQVLATPDPLVRAAAVLNSVEQADPWTARLRAQINAQIANQGAV